MLSRRARPSSQALAKDGAPHAHERGALLHCDFVIVRHPHRQMPPRAAGESRRELVAQQAQRPEDAAQLLLARGLWRELSGGIAPALVRPDTAEVAR